MPTIGVAVAVPDPWGEQLRKHRSSFGDPLADTIPTHVTLLPPTEVEPGDLPIFTDHLASVATGHAPFEIYLRGTATFRPVSPVVFMSLAQGISECEELAGAVRESLLCEQPRFPYHPHVTVAHDVADAALDTAFEALADYDCRFGVDRFQLYLHHPDKGWVCEREFELQAPAADW
ncbi:MAG: 2'-5' RNA ligase family protein [Nocardioidaceae bacterium]